VHTATRTAKPLKMAVSVASRMNLALVARRASIVFMSPKTVLRCLSTSGVPPSSPDKPATPRAQSTPPAKVKPAGAYNNTLLGIDEEYWHRPGVWDDKNLTSLRSANQAWASRLKADGFFAEDQRKGHAPKILWIGCSDARVPANEMIGEAPGNVFVHRNIANQVVNTDFNCMSVIQYAVDVLQVKHIIVCGHYDCGGVKAALVNMDHSSPLENWLRNIRDIHQHHFAELSAIKDLPSRQRRLVEISTIEQCLNIFKTAAVQRRRVATHLQSQEPGSRITFAEPVVHAFVYDPDTGDLKKMDVDFKNYMRTYSDVFNLYNVGASGPVPAGSAADADISSQSASASLSISDIIHDSLVEEGAIDGEKKK